MIISISYKGGSLRGGGKGGVLTSSDNAPNVEDLEKEMFLSTGIITLDSLLEGIKLGDNIVWHAPSMTCHRGDRRG
ncbi:MAG: hypothetical protein V3T58_05655 [Candidatus Hydrothermarchaeales archaeon]